MFVDRLSEYRRRRAFSITPEPAGAQGEGGATGGRFVVQQHHARALHWDLRLERDGLLASWAVPKGIPLAPGVNRLAKRTEDHPKEYLDFEGTIPPGEYGAGRMSIWDRGTFECERWDDHEVLIALHGGRLEGRYVLIRTRDTNWLLRRLDAADDPGRRRPPEGGPMLATAASELPTGDDWRYELKWDGMRCLALIEGGRVELRSRTGAIVTSRYPELRALGAAFGSTEVLLDGEIVAVDGEGRPDFHRLQLRMHATGDTRIRRLALDVPVVFMVFDILWLDGHDVTGWPFIERRALLDDLGLAEGGDRAGASWQLSPCRSEASALLVVAERFDLEGLMAKQADAPYLMGRRSTSWRKIRRSARQELVVGGWVPGRGTRAETIGGLLVGYHDDRGALRYAGRVGSGLSTADLRRLEESLAPLTQVSSPFVDRGTPRDAHWVSPEIVVEVRFREWTPTGRLRHPTFLGIRPDVPAAEVVREPT